MRLEQLPIKEPLETNSKRYTIMAERIKLLSGASAFLLMVLMGAALFGVSRCQDSQLECENELFVDLNDGKLSHAQAEEKLRSVDVGDRDTVTIGTVSVTRLLNLKDKPCKLEDLTGRDVLLSESDFKCGADKGNKGAETFLRHYMPKWKMSCAKVMSSVWQETFRSFAPEEREILENICPDKRPALLTRGWLKYDPQKDGSCVYSAESSKLSHLAKSATERKYINSGCARLIQELSKFRSSGEMKLLALGYEFMSRWSTRMKVCKDHFDSLCYILDGISYIGHVLSDDERELCKSMKEFKPIYL